MTATACPDCGHSINLGPDPKEGHIVTCRFCRNDFEIINTDPLELDWQYTEPHLDADLPSALSISADTDFSYFSC
jgi:hypothetical protein